MNLTAANPVRKTAFEVRWDWPEIACMLMWRLAPHGVTITRKDLGGLPMDRVLLEERSSEGIRFEWVTLAEAERRTAPGTRSHTNAQPRAGVSQLQGRWQKIGVVLMWKLARDGITLTHGDREAVPKDQQLLAHGYKSAIKYRFVTRTEAVRIVTFDRENEGRIIMEHL